MRHNFHERWQAVAIKAAFAAFDTSSSVRSFRWAQGGRVFCCAVEICFWTCPHPQRLSRHGGRLHQACDYGSAVATWATWQGGGILGNGVVDPATRLSPEMLNQQ